MYPTHGAGIIEGIHEEEQDGELKQYYIIQLSIQELRIMIPVGKEEKIGIRPVVDYPTLVEIREKLQGVETNLTIPQKERISSNKEKIKTGCMEDLLTVIRDLTRYHAEKPLSSVEKQLLQQANSILRSELKLVKDGLEEDSFCFS